MEWGGVVFSNTLRHTKREDKGAAINLLDITASVDGGLRRLSGLFFFLKNENKIRKANKKTLSGSFCNILGGEWPSWHTSIIPRRFLSNGPDWKLENIPAPFSIFTAWNFYPSIHLQQQVTLPQRVWHKWRGSRKGEGERESEKGK